MIRFDPICCIAAAFALLLLPFDWLLSVLTAAAVHECSHILTVLVLGGKVNGIRFGVSGCVIDSGVLGDAESLLSILAGPVSSLGLICLRNICPKIAVCGLLQGLFNLLPILQLDGGRILQILLLHTVPQREARIMQSIKYGILVFGAVMIGISCIV